MTNTRRDFLHSTLATAAVLATGAQAARRGGEAKPAGKALQVLVFGGTGFIGPKLVEHAIARGHTVTMFNRGKTNADLFPDVEKIKGNRWPDKDEGLKGLEGRKWDVVFDDNGYYLRQVAESAKLLAPNVGHYVYVSSISAYAKNDVVGADETAALASLADPTVETMGANFEHYGGLKVVCERAAEEALPGRVTVIRPGYIVGPGDPTDRFTYWPVRFARGGDVVVPGAPDDPLQVIDVRDLAEWMVRVAEQKTIGTFNACGPKERLSWGRTLEACEKAAGKPAKKVWLGYDALEKHKDDPALQKAAFHIWAPSKGDSAGFHTWSNRRAVEKGLTFRTIDATAADTLAWWNTLPEERRAKAARGWISADDEAALAKLAAG